MQIKSMREKMSCTRQLCFSIKSHVKKPPQNYGLEKLLDPDDFNYLPNVPEKHKYRL